MNAIVVGYHPLGIMFVEFLQKDQVEQFSLFLDNINWLRLY